MKAKARRNYKKMPDLDLLKKAKDVRDAFKNKTPYPAGVRPKVDFASDVDDFDAAIVQADSGSHADIAGKKNLRATIIADLDGYADFTDSDSGGDASVILSYGFEPTDTQHSKIILTIPAIKSADNSVSGKIKLVCSSVHGAYSYEAELTTPAGVKTSQGGFSDSRNLLLEGVTPGTLYTIRVRATGGGSQRGDWSLPITIMAT